MEVNTFCFATHPCFTPHALKGQKLLAQGTALGILTVSKTPCKGKSFIITKYFKAFALTGRMFIIIFYTQGAALG